MYTDGCVHIKVKSKHSAFCGIRILINRVCISYGATVTYVQLVGNGNAKKSRNRICVGYIESTSVGNTEGFYFGDCDAWQSVW
jgi:hypothetical protein